MSKTKNKNAENEEMKNNTATAPAIDDEDLSSFGAVDETLSAQAEEVDPFTAIPTAVPGKEGSMEEGRRTIGFAKVGQVLAGFFVRTKRVESDKFTAGKIDPETGMTYRDLHILRDAKGRNFGIWSVGQLGAAFRCLRPDDYIEVQYMGLGEVIRKGQSAPHTFKFKAKAANGGKIVFDWDALPENDHAPMTAQGAEAPQARQ